MHNHYRKRPNLKGRFRRAYRTAYKGWNIFQSTFPASSMFYSEESENPNNREELGKLEEKKKLLEEKIHHIQNCIENLNSNKDKNPPVSGEKTGLIAVVNRVRCLACGICASFCPQGAIKIIDFPLIDRSICTGCGTCIPSCPIGAISLKSVTELK